MQAKGVYSKKGLVPQTVYWLVDGKNFLGKLSIRHKLTKYLKNFGGHIGYYIRPSQRGKGYGREILRLGLKKAKLLGIKNVLITCSIKNDPSRRVIEGNGGKFLNKKKMTQDIPDRLRYSIKNI